MLIPFLLLLLAFAVCCGAGLAAGRLGSRPARAAVAGGAATAALGLAVLLLGPEDRGVPFFAGLLLPLLGGLVALAAHLGARRATGRLPHPTASALGLALGYGVVHATAFALAATLRRSLGGNELGIALVALLALVIWLLAGLTVAAGVRMAEAADARRATSGRGPR
jgi:hypothetical protein